MLWTAQVHTSALRSLTHDEYPSFMHWSEEKGGINPHMHVIGDARTKTYIMISRVLCLMSATVFLFGEKCLVK